MNREYSREIIKSLLSWGVEEFYICAGARDIPLIETVCNIKSENKIVFNHFEERSAGFYALGRLKSLQKPVAVITTSGTAVGELLPAVMEAFYSGLPLVLLTADRPKSYRGTGAPQSAEQKNIFGTYVSKCFDLEHGETLNISELPKNKPVHINICFDIPLQSGNLEHIIKNDFLQKVIDIESPSHKDSFLSDKLKLESFINKAQNLLVVVSQIFSKENTGTVNFIKNLGFPVYIESISNIRENNQLESLKIKCADKIWANSKKSDYIIDSVLKIGGTPTHRIWRDLDESNKNIKVLSISENYFSGMPNAENICTNINEFLSKINLSKKERRSDLLNKFFELDQDCFLKMNELFNTYPEAEQSIFYHLSNKIEKNSRVYLGNSLPIRYWDLAATFENKKLSIDASRGLNGIDGQISSFLGFADEMSKENWGIFGDLTTLYDMAGFWMLQQRPKLKANITVINNKGGRIFSKVLTGEVSILCQNIHDLNFEYLAKFWGIEYEKVANVNEINASNMNRIIEIIPNNDQTELFSTLFSKI